MQQSRRAFSFGAATALGVARFQSTARANERLMMSSESQEVGQARYARFDNDGFSGWRPFSLDAASHLILSVEANGIETSAIIDSGAGRTLVDRGFAQRLNLRLASEFRAAGVTTNAYGNLADGLVIQIGSASLLGIEAAVLDLSAIATATGRPVNLILGRDLFEMAVVDLDFSNCRAGLFESSFPPPSPDDKELQLAPDERGRRYTAISICGLADVLACYDLGSDVSLVISPDYAEEHSLLSGLKVSSVASAGVGGASVGKVAVVPQIKLAGVTLTNVPIQVPSKWNQSGPVLAGLPIWSRFNNLIDYSHDRLRLTPIPAALSAPFAKDRSGIGAAWQGGEMVIIHVAQGSPAEAVGLKEGDRIVSIGGKVVDVGYLSSHPRIGAKPAGTIVLLGLKDGRNIQLVLADYF